MARRRGWSGWVVRLVALLLVVQGAVLAFSQGASADAMRRDQFGNVLCLASAEMGHGAEHGKPDRHADMLACCSLGCAMFAGLTVPAPDYDAPIDVSARAQMEVFVSYRSAIAGFAETPRTTRGPPSTI